MSWLYFANRLIELPLGIVGVAMGTVLVPELTRALRGDDRTAVAHAESRGLELAVGLALPATLGLIVLSEPIVRMLFEHGAFTAADTAATAQALIWLALGLPAHVLVKALSPAFFARDDTSTPLMGDAEGIRGRDRFGAWCSATLFGAGGIAASIALGAWSSALALIRRRRGDIRIFDRCRGAPAAAAHWRGGAGDGRAAVAGDAVRCWRQTPTATAWRRPLRCWLLIVGRDRGLWPAARPARRNRLARGAQRDQANRRRRDLRALRRAWQTTAREQRETYTMAMR